MFILFPVVPRGSWGQGGPQSHKTGRRFVSVCAVCVCVAVFPRAVWSVYEWKNTHMKS